MSMEKVSRSGATGASDRAIDVTSEKLCPGLSILTQDRPLYINDSAGICMEPKVSRIICLNLVVTRLL